MDEGGIQERHRQIGTDLFRGAMGMVVGNVSIITAGVKKDRSGMVASSVVSLSADPPKIIACINRSSSTWPLIVQYRHLGVSSLAVRHKAIAERFSGFDGTKGVDRFVGAEWTTLETGASLLQDANVILDCALDEMIDRGTHSIVIGTVVAARTRETDDALVYWRKAYRPLRL
ncbi:flavin reductase family protein [Shinella sumterensis]|uniref:flavin reductase family protein n=1 Tax=Shinella sumterensis TaxID=1967501 RepID=UPI003F8432E6